MSIFGFGQPGPTKINRVQINQSVLGYVIPVVMGKGRVQQTILWADGLTSKKVSPDGGKGIGGGKTGTEYAYSADVVAAICNGGGYVLGIDDVWSGQSWLSTETTEESYTITSGTPIYVPINASNLAVDTGVRIAHAYSVTTTDVGGATTTVSGTTTVSLRRVTYGTTLDSGTYSIDDNGKYYFASADAGSTVTISYSFTLTKTKQQTIALIPSGRTVQVGSSTQKLVTDGGVVYATGTNEGKAFTKVSSPTAAGQYSVSGSAPATYTFASADINQEVRLTYFLDNTASIPEGTATVLNFTLLEGTKGQTPWALLQSNFPDAALGYSGIALAAYGPMDLGYGAQIQQNTFEVLTADAWGGSIVDCSPVQCILRVLTDAAWGLGSGPVTFPTSAIDNGASGTWGSPTATGSVRQESTAVAWFAANGFFISPVLDQQDTAASLISRWLEAGQCAGFMSEGLLKLVPFGDTSTVGNGVVWVAPQTLAATLDDSCFLQKNEGEDPVQIASTAWPDAYNHVQVNWNNRSQQYSPELTYESDQASINRYGQRIEDPQSWDFVTTLPSATFAAALRVQRNVYVRNTYTFSLSHRYSDLEPMDIVSLTTSSSWSLDNRLQISGMLARIRKVVDNPDGTLDIEAEEYMFGTNQPALFNKGASSGSLLSNGFASPGNAEVVLFEPPSALVGYPGNQIWMGACGVTADWGSCNIYASLDGDTYKSIGTIETPARLGVLVSALAAGADPDTSDSLVVALATGSAGLDGGTNADADAGTTMCFVDSELLSYSSCAVTGPNQYTMSGYLRRGQKGSTRAAHSVGSNFLRLDNAIFKYTYDTSWIGKTVYLKFQSVNAYGNSAQDLSQLTPLAYTIQGDNGGSIGSGNLPPNVPQNTYCNAVITTAWNSGTSKYDVYINGPGGSGSSWQNYVGSAITSYPSGVLYNFSPSVSAADISTWYIAYNTQGGYFLFATVFGTSDVLNDYNIFIGGIDIPTAP